MLTRRSLLTTGALGLAATAAAAQPAATRILVVTGGHAFDPSFFDLFRARPDWKWEHRQHEPKSTSTAYAREFAADYDVVVLYDFLQRINETEQRHFLQIFERGKGLIVLHHALCNYETWETYHQITGMRLRNKEEGALPKMIWKHDVHFRLERVDTPHPVLEGVPSFPVLDETYGNLFMGNGNQALLTTPDPTSSPVVGWARTHGASRVVAIQPGHGPRIFADANYRKLLGNAVRWVSKTRS